MIQHQGVYLPDGEKHLVEWMTKSGEIVHGRGTYQIKKLRAATAFCRDYRVAVDIGAHCGLWSMQLERLFDRVEAFEPVAAHRECFQLNLYGKERVRLHDCALGAHAGYVRMETAPTSSGDTRVAEECEALDFEPADDLCPLRMLDSFELEQVDFMKLDCEGYELNALLGGSNTIARCLPVIIVEQKPGRAQRFGLAETGAVQWLEQTHGYACAREMSGDYILVPGGRV